MKLKYLILLCSLALLSYSCEENSMNINDDNLLLGSWIEPNYEGERITFKRSNKLLDKSYGITFIQNGSFTEKTSGFCGTPPLSFFNIEGTFALDNNLISISNDGRLIALANEDDIIKVWSVNEKAEYLSSIADEVIFLGGKIGIGPMFLKSEYEILLETTKEYNKCIDKII